MQLSEYGMQVEQDALSANDSLSEDEEYITHEVNKDIKENEKNKHTQEHSSGFIPKANELPG